MRKDSSRTDSRSLPRSHPPADAAPAAAAASISLDDRCVLCVGGLTGARNHYRAEIETRSGRFIHHDGGREDNLHRLTPMLAAADIVICASGNISHNAYHLVKSTCKKLGKPCVLVKGTGIASFLDGLGTLAQARPTEAGLSARGDSLLRHARGRGR